MHNKIAFITGATSGIGAVYAREFASQGYDLIITGRRAEKIKALADELMAQHKINIEVVIAELANNDDLDLLIKKIADHNNIEILINNAGFGQRGNFHTVDLKIYENMLNVHDLATMKLTHAVLPSMLANKKGSIINVSSVVAFIPFTNNAVYAGSKAFINLFTEAISTELKGTGVQVQVLCPGLTATDVFEKMGENVEEVAKQRNWFWTYMSAEAVVAKSLKCLAKNKVICIPGFRNKLMIIWRTLGRLF